MIFIFYVVLLIVQVIYLIKAIKSKELKSWKLLFSTIILSVSLLFLFTLLYYIYQNDIGYDLVWYLILSIFTFVIYQLVLIISIIVRVINYKRGNIVNNSDDDSIKKSIKKNAIIIVIVFIVSLLIESVPYGIKSFNEGKNQAKAKEEVITMLNKKYGDGNFEVEDMNVLNVCYACLFDQGIDLYEIRVKSSYLNNSFIVSLRQSDLSVLRDEFLDVYYKEKNNVDNLKVYLQDKKIEDFNSKLSKSFNIRFSFNNVYIDDYLNMDYGHVPSISELTSFVKLYDPRIEILDNITSKDDLLDYLIRLTKYYINDVDTTSISYQSDSKYFRYKYDYTKMGIYDYKDQFSGYGGYVYAGKTIYSDELGHYVTIDEDKIIRIGIMGNITTINMEDMLK